MKTRSTWLANDDKQRNALREKLADNRKKLEDIARHIGEKNEELARLKEEMDELSRQYSGERHMPGNQ